MSQLHPGPENCIWAASRSTQTHPGLKMWMSNASRSFFTYIQEPRFLSHLHPCTLSPPSRYQDSTKAPIYMPHLHLGRVSPPSRAHLTSIQILRIASQPHHSPISPYPGLKMLIQSQSMSDLTHIHVSRICASPPYRHLDSRLHTINSMHHLNPGLFIFNSPPFVCCLISILAHVFAYHLHLWHDVRASRLPITTIHVMRIVSHLHHSPISPYSGLRLCVSTQSRSILNPTQVPDLCLSSIQAPRFTSPLHPSWVSPQSRSLYLHLAYIPVASNLHPGLPNCIWAPSKHHLKCIHVSRCVSHLHLGHFSTGELYLSSIPVPYHPSSSQDVHLNPIQVPYQPHPDLEFCVSCPPRLPDSHFFLVSVESCLNIAPDICISPTSR